MLRFFLLKLCAADLYYFTHLEKDLQVLIYTKLHFQSCCYLYYFFFNIQEMTTDLVTPPRRKRRKVPNDEEVPRLVTKNVVVLRRGQVDEMGDTVMMPHTTIDMSNIKRKGQSKKINFEGSERSEDIGKKLVQTFDFLAGKR